jgi:TRAP-type C4-dicarboxylate transport system substrate-binding protein
MRFFLQSVSLAIALALFSFSPPAGAETYKLRVSLDTSATHVRTQSFADYLQKLQAASGGRIETELFHSAQLFRDRDVMKALRQGGIEMAAPGTWQLTGLVPDTDIFQLPAFFGQDAEIVHAFTDGPNGKKIDDELEKKLGVKIMGKWIDLGYQNTYSTGKPLNSFADYAGMKIRNSGGAGQFARAKFFGATPNTIAWPDVPLALSQGTVDGLSSTNESLVSAKLWDSGVKFGYSDRSFFAFYVPMVAESFLKKLPPDLQKLVFDTWEQNIGTYRDNMAKAQQQARTTLEEHGVKFADPSPQLLADTRAKMMAGQEDMVKELKITPELAAAATAQLASATH